MGEKQILGEIVNSLPLRSFRYLWSLHRINPSKKEEKNQSISQSRKDSSPFMAVMHPLEFRPQIRPSSKYISGRLSEPRSASRFPPTCVGVQPNRRQSACTANLAARIRSTWAIHNVRWANLRAGHGRIMADKMSRRKLSETRQMIWLNFCRMRSWKRDSGADG